MLIIYVMHRSNPLRSDCLLAWPTVGVFVTTYSIALSLKGSWVLHVGRPCLARCKYAGSLMCCGVLQVVPH